MHCCHAGAGALDFGGDVGELPLELQQLQRLFVDDLLRPLLDRLQLGAGSGCGLEQRRLGLARCVELALEAGNRGVARSIARLGRAQGFFQLRGAQPFCGDDRSQLLYHPCRHVHRHNA